MLNIAVVPLVLDAQLVLQRRLFWELSLYGRIASIAQGRRKRHPCAQSARRQRPCCRPLPLYVFFSKMNMPLTQVALVARPCAPAAQLLDGSSTQKFHLPKVAQTASKSLSLLRRRLSLKSSLRSASTDFLKSDI